MSKLLSQILLLVICLPAFSQTVVYTRQFTETGPTDVIRVSSKRINIYNIFTPSKEILVNIQIGFPAYQDSLNKDFLSVGAGLEGKEKMTIGFWGKKFWKVNETLKLGVIVKRSTFNFVGGYTIRWAFPLIYKESFTIAPEFFSLRNPKKTINDFGITAGVKRKIVSFGLTYWQARKIFFLSVKLHLLK